jgi:hypothetical protein
VKTGLKTFRVFLRNRVNGLETRLDESERWVANPGVAPKLFNPRLFQAILQGNKRKIDILVQAMQVRLEAKDDWSAAIELDQTLSDIFLTTMGSEA